MTRYQKALITRVVNGVEANRAVRDGWIGASRLAAYHLDSHRHARLRGVPREEIIDYAVSKGAKRAILNTEMED